MNLDDRMKLYESCSLNDFKFSPLLPVILRLDGRAFHTFTKGLKRPYDSNFRQIMLETTKYLVYTIGAKIGYTQSDEITLVLYSSNTESEIFFDGRKDKLISVVASLCSVRFNLLLSRFLPDKKDHSPVFDCRAFTVPNKVEACNCLVWREMDATRNSIIAAAQSLYNHEELMNKSSNEMQEMIFQKGINWNDYPSHFKRGCYVQRVKILRKYTTEEIELLPANHAAKTNPNLVIERRMIKHVDMPTFSKIMNKEEVVFDGHPPLEIIEVK